MHVRMQRLDNEAKERGKRICAMRHHLEALHRRIVDRKHRLRALCAGIEVMHTSSAVNGSSTVLPFCQKCHAHGRHWRKEFRRTAGRRCYCLCNACCLHSMTQLYTDWVKWSFYRGPTSV